MPRTPRLRRWCALVAVIAATAGACASGLPGAESASPSATTAAPAGPDASTSPAPNASTVIPAYLDIVTARAVGKAGTLELSLDLAAPVPTGTPQVGELSYVFDLDTDGDSKPDYTAALSLVPGGGFRPVLRNERSGQRLEGPAFPGSANLAGAAISLTLDARALGCPRIVRVRAASHQTSGGRTAGDAAADWIVVNVGCGGTG